MDHDKMFTRHCGQLEPFEIEFERRFFRVTFRSNDRLDGTGFNATYHFINYPVVRTTLPASSSSAQLYYCK
ncbi:hypothetical protein O3M35_008840 [Rhynocoris fuscipes]|uniref:CUB domain-containing protein n=1 Tax=Rhynocoris fuscipes TaxID=488301 RepID=A0AAW1DCX4_9HEMI